jgi:beta-glucosidase-like glycosyl hydrolase
MDALKGRGNIYAECLNAGVDILLHPEDADSAVNELKEAFESGALNEEKAYVAHERVLRFRSKLKCNNKPAQEYKEHERTASLIYDKSITLVKNAPHILPPANMQKVSLVFAADKNDFDISPLKTHIEQSIPLEKCNDSDQRETTIFALFTNIAAWRGSSGIKDEDINKIKNLMKKSRKSIVIAFGSPYVLRHFKEADVLIAAYDSGMQAQSSVVKCLKGEREFQGSLPVKLSLQ